MKKLFIFLIASLISYASSGQQYAVSSIPKPLLSRAGAVIRKSETTIEVKSLNHVVYREKTAVTILNSSGDDEAVVKIYYDKENQIKSAKGSIFDEFGLQTGKFSEKMFSDMSAANDFSLYEDSRMKRYKPLVTIYPYTIEYEIELKVNNTLTFPDWVPLNSTGTAIEHSSLTFICPKTFGLRYKEINYPGQVVSTTEKDNKLYQWKVSNIVALRNEPYSPDAEQYLTMVKFAPEKFAYSGNQGAFSNWEQYGKWVNENLLKDRDVLPAATTAYILKLVKGIDDPKQKARIIYEYMQNKSRYVSVQIGIGGFQPYPASQVDQFSYGDCKGLVNYTKALLKVAGVESYYTIVNASSFKKDMDPNFASLNDGNHIILCLPFKNDTTWLECTSKTSPFGYLGDFTDDRLVLACTPDGGKLMRTPKLSYEANKQIRKAKFSLSASGDLVGMVRTTFEGSQYENHGELHGEVFAEQKKKLARLYPIPNIEIKSLNYRQEKDIQPVATEMIQLASYNYAPLTGNKMIVSLNPVNKSTSIPKEVRNRANPVFINRGYMDEDEIIYEIPDGFQVDYQFNEIVIEKPFGLYKASIDVKDRQVIYKRTMVIKDGLYPVNQYNDLVQFYQSVAEADQSKITLTR